MKERVELLVREFRDARRHRLRFEAAVTALSVLVTGGVFWQLRRVGTAISEEGAPPGVPVIETDADPPDQTAEAAETAEDPADWEALLPEFTDESPQQRIAAIAVSQLGYTEGEGEVLLSDDGTSRTGYTRYGAWYGNPYGEWNTVFTYFCMYYAGIEKDRIPYGSGCWAWYETLSENGMLTPCGNETEGDIIFFDSDADGEPDRTGIVSGTEETEEGVQIHVIAGNCEGAVAEQQYLRGGSDMVGVLSVDSYLTEPLTPSEPEIVLISYSADSESGIHVDAQAAEGVFPEGAVMSVQDVSLVDVIGSETIPDALGRPLQDAVAVDITFRDAEGNELEPFDEKKVHVQIVLPETQKLPEGCFELLHIPESDAAPENMAEANVSADGAVFETDAFSVYVMTSWGETGPQSDIQIGDTGKYPVNNPLQLYVGQTVCVYEDLNAQNGSFWVGNNNNNKLVRTADGNDTWTNPSDGVYRCTAKYSGNSAGNCTIHTPGGNEINVHVNPLPSPIYLTTKRGILPNNNDTRNELNGNTTDPYYHYIGDEIEVIMYTPLDNTDGFWSDTDQTGLEKISGDTITEENGVRKVTATYRCTKAINSGLIGFGYHAGTGWTDSFNVNVTRPIYVENAIGTRNMNEVNEWLSILGGEKRNGYYANSSGRPYLMSVGDTLNIFTPSADPNERFSSSNTNIIRQDGEQTNNGETLSATFVATAVGDTTIRLPDGTTMHVQVRQRETALLDHSDIEIADGGKCTMVKTVRKKDGSIEKIVRVYRTNVSAVNTCKLYSSTDDSTYIPFYTNTQFYPGATWPPAGDIFPPALDANMQELHYQIDSNYNVVNDESGNPMPIIGYITDNYGTDPSIRPGMPQFELTSKYKPHVDENGNPYYTNWSNIKFFAKDVEHAVFDVQLLLEPMTETVITTKDGVTTTGETKSIENTGDIHIPSTLFRMDHQDVIDAWNKCPNHSGLDFTVTANLAMLQLQANKKLLGGTLAGNDFEFQLYEVDTQGTEKLISTARNNAEGEIDFADITYMKPGTYTYRMRENKDPSISDIYYDKREYVEFNVVVTKNEDNSLIAEVEVQNGDELEFVNYGEIHLPETGGTGPLPYLAAGILLISAAFALPLIRRRKEDE